MQRKNCHISPKPRVTLTTEKGKEEEKDATRSVWLCRKHLTCF